MGDPIPQPKPTRPKFNGGVKQGAYVLVALIINIGMVIGALRAQSATIKEQQVEIMESLQGVVGTVTELSEMVKITNAEHNKDLESMSRQLEDLKGRLALQETYMTNTRERLIALEGRE